jgi:hypothetical protein
VRPFGAVGGAAADRGLGVGGFVFEAAEDRGCFTVVGEVERAAGDRGVLGLGLVADSAEQKVMRPGLSPRSFVTA